MIAVHDIDGPSSNNSRPPIEIHQPISSLSYLLDKTTDLRSIPCNSRNQFFDPINTATTLQTSKTSKDNKIEALISRKRVLLKKRNYIFNSLLFRLFNLQREKVDVIDSELDKIETEILFIREPELQNEITRAKDLIKKTTLNISRYKSEINEIT